MRRRDKLASQSRPRSAPNYLESESSCPLPCSPYTYDSLAMEPQAALRNPRRDRRGRFCHGLSRPRSRAGPRGGDQADPSQYLSEPRQLDRYWQEAQLLASLEHRNIMTIYDMVRAAGLADLGTDAGQPARRPTASRWTWTSCALCLSCSLQALEYLHANNVIHGDIKPSNLFVDKRNWVKVGDFGLARRVSNEQGSLLKGTTRYMAPELVSAAVRPGRTGQRSLFAGLHGLRIDVRHAVRFAVSRRWTPSAATSRSPG